MSNKSKLKKFPYGKKSAFIRDCLDDGVSGVDAIINEANKNGFELDRASVHSVIFSFKSQKSKSKNTNKSTDRLINQPIFRQNNNHVIEGIKMNFLGFDYDDMTKVLHLVVERMGILKTSTM